MVLNLQESELIHFFSSSSKFQIFLAVFSWIKPSTDPFIIYIYFLFLLGGEERTIEFLDREGRLNTKTPLLEHSLEKGTIKHVFPMNLFLKPWKIGGWVYRVIKIGIVQYVRLPLTIDALLSNAF